MLNWTGICTGLVYWTGMASPVHTTHQSSPVHTTHQSSTYNTPVHNTLYVVSCMYSTSMLHEGEGKGMGHCPCTWEGGGEKYMY